MRFFALSLYLPYNKCNYKLSKKSENEQMAINYIQALDQVVDNSSLTYIERANNVTALLDEFDKDPAFSQSPEIPGISFSFFTDGSFLLKLIDMDASEELIKRVISYPWINQVYADLENSSPTVSSMAMLCYKRKYDLIDLMLSKGISLQAHGEKKNSSPMLYFISGMNDNELASPFFKKLCDKANLINDEVTLKFILMSLLRAHSSSESSIEKVKYLMSFANLEVDSLELFNDFDKPRHKTIQSHFSSMGFMEYALLANDLKIIEYALQNTKKKNEALEFIKPLLGHLKSNPKEVQNHDDKVALLQSYSVMLQEKQELEKAISTLSLLSAPIKKI